MKTAIIALLALGGPLVGFQVAVAESGLDATMEIAKQVPALLVLVWLVSKFASFVQNRDDQFLGQVESMTAGFRESHDRSTEALIQNTRATTRLFETLKEEDL